ncbi:Mu transposase C-terminal domain-containing protein [Ktedonospora formicarum]|uniref:DDE-type integrase/transposase/recombinase n=1 Tax=Ktedonospora formicarum TaxID=2778364 RepID=A0A8J3MYN9_9CHLR|nr:Mu transposase C-terminal domain-containing protein [Ktedonospora formicarum]GHO51146.1 DDE-type integrase/transposase/recombinase [Ktedonospora formicarum]
MCGRGGAANGAVASIGVPLSTLQRWIRQYREDGLCGLARQPRADRGTRRNLSEEMIKVIEGLALCKPRRSVATIQRQVSALVLGQGWVEPSYRQVYEIVKALPQALVTLAQEGGEAYREEYELLYRREAARSNEMWQADHCLLPIWVKDEQGKSRRPWLTVIEDDKSRAIAGYRLSWSSPSAIQTALTLRQAMWRKEDARWQVCGIPDVFYTDHGSDFTSVHLEQVGADLKMQLVFSQVGRPRGRGKIERFFRSVEQLLLEQLPGYAPKEAWPRTLEPGREKERLGVMTLSDFEQCFRDWLLSDYHSRVQKGQRKGPQERWEEEGFLPRMPESLEQLDLLLVQVARKRRVQQSGIAFEGYAYLDPTLSAYVGEEVMIRYDPLDLAELRVFFEDRFVCRAVCPELSGQTVSLKEIVAARQRRRRQLRVEIVEREALVKRYTKMMVRTDGAVSQEPEKEQENEGEESDVLGLQRGQEAALSPKRLKRYRNE